MATPTGQLPTQGAAMTAATPGVSTNLASRALPASARPDAAAPGGGAPAAGPSGAPAQQSEQGGGGEGAQTGQGRHEGLPAAAGTGSAGSLPAPGLASTDASAEPLAAGVPAEALWSSAEPQLSTPVGAGVDLQQMIESVRATIEMAARQGVTQVRIALQPKELGDVRIHLSQTSEGLLARVSADTPAAAQALASGRAELHQSLSSLGVSLLRLDIGSFGQADAGGREGRFNGDSGRSSSSPDTSTVPVEDESMESAGDPDLAGLPAGLASGGLVNVLA
jgi:flagellar hook-length control protein FliK